MLFSQQCFSKDNGNRGPIKKKRGPITYYKLYKLK